MLIVHAHVHMHTARTGPLLAYLRTYLLTNTLVLQDPSADVNVAGMVAGM